MYVYRIAFLCIFSVERDFLVDAELEEMGSLGECSSNSSNSSMGSTGAKVTVSCKFVETRNSPLPTCSSSIHRYHYLKSLKPVESEWQWCQVWKETENGSAWLLTLHGSLFVSCCQKCHVPRCAGHISASLPLCKVRTWTRAVRRRHVTGIFACDYLLVPLHHEATPKGRFPMVEGRLDENVKTWNMQQVDAIQPRRSTIGL